MLALSKRQYMGRDLLDDRYGRFRELPLALARQGASVRGLCLSYRPRPEGALLDEECGASVQWQSLDLRRLLPLGASSYWRAVDRLREKFAPDVVWAGSDVPHAQLGLRVARRLDAALVLDLYDNFEAYPLARVPGCNFALRGAVRAANAIACISSPLAHKVRTDYGYAGPLAVVENAVPSAWFAKRDREASRRRLGLPIDATLVGTAGALSPTRGTGALLQAFVHLAAERPDAHLVLAGTLDPALSLPAHSRLHYLGSLPPNDVPTLLAALDLSVVCNRDSDFGRYCFPQKLYESLACRVPVVVARVGAMAELLAPWPRSLYDPDDADSLLAALRTQLAQPQLPDLPIPAWDELGEKLSSLMREALAVRR